MMGFFFFFGGPCYGKIPKMMGLSISGFKYSAFIVVKYLLVKFQGGRYPTVDGRNPAPPGMYKTLYKMGCLTYQLVQDFYYQQYPLPNGETSSTRRKVHFFRRFRPTFLTPLGGFTFIGAQWSTGRKRIHGTLCLFNWPYFSDCTKVNSLQFTTTIWDNTLPEKKQQTHLKIDVVGLSFREAPIFRCYVSFRGGIFLLFPSIEHANPRNCQCISAYVDGW